MALVRCIDHGRPGGGKRTYVISVKPVGYPKTAAICGRSGCQRPGLVWLDEEDKRTYDNGERIVRVPNSAVKIKVE